MTPESYSEEARANLPIESVDKRLSRFLCPKVYPNSQH